MAGDADNGRRRINQACDACKRRKVRCNGQQRCQQCEHFNLKCNYSVTTRGRPRKGAATRGSVIEECRRSTKGSRRMSTAKLKIGKDTSSSLQTNLTRLPPIQQHLEASFFLDLIPEYNSVVYPVNPIITDKEIINCVNIMYTSRETASFLYAYAAVTINLSRTDIMQLGPDIKAQVSQLVNRSFQELEPLNLSTRPSLLKIVRNIFLEICLMGLDQGELAFFYLREAISMLQMMGVGGIDPDYAKSEQERHQLDRAYWECFIHERFTALTDYKPTCLRVPSKFPSHDASLDPGIELGWNNIIKTFVLVDDPFISYWVSDRTLIPAEWFEQKHKELDDDEWEVEVHLLDDMQQADLIITRQWLRTLLWQMALSNILLSSNSSSEYLSLTLPLRLSSQLRQFLSTLTIEAVGIHGTGILHKLFDITITIADVVIQLPYTSREDILKRADDVLFLKRFLFSFPRIQPSQKVALTERVDKMMYKYPEIAELKKLTYASPGSELESVSVEI